MKAIELILLLVAVVILGYIFSYFAQRLSAPTTEMSRGSICFDKKCFNVEIAKTNFEREKGLMGRDKLDDNSGMLFIFEKEGLYSFWMKNTLIPLDMAWLDSSGKIVFIKENAEPCKSIVCPSVIPQAQAKYVLEINGGKFSQEGIKVGDRAEINL
jgi:uncharacterized membrane protein (UPF0127 family)